MKKMVLDNNIYDVVTLEAYTALVENDYADPKVAVEFKGYVYPKRNKTDSEPGLYTDGILHYMKRVENEEESEKYKDSNIINFKSDNLRELIEKSNTLKNIEKELLTNPENIFVPPLLSTDSSEMRCLKQAIIEKQIDIDKYKDRFGPNFNNDKRLFSSDNISILKLKSITNNLDMKATLIIEDRSSDVPNPIGKKIIVEIDSGVED